MSRPQWRAEHLVSALGAKLKQITKFNDGRVLWPSIGYDGKAIVFERDFKIWKLDTKIGEAFQLPLKLMGVAAGPGTDAPDVDHILPISRSRPIRERKSRWSRTAKFSRSGAKEGGASDARHPHARTRIRSLLVARFHQSCLCERAQRRQPRVHLRFSEARRNAVDARSLFRSLARTFRPMARSIAFVRGAQASCESSIRRPNRKSPWSSGSIARGFAAWRLRVVARQQVDRLCGLRRRNGLRNIFVVQASRRGSPADQLPGEQQCELDALESGRHVTFFTKPASAPKRRKSRAST